MIGDTSLLGLGGGRIPQPHFPESDMTRVERGVVADAPRPHADPLSSSEPNSEGGGKAGERGASSEKDTFPQPPPQHLSSASVFPSQIDSSLSIVIQKVQAKTVHLRALQQVAQAAVASGDHEKIKAVETQVRATLAKVGGILQDVQSIISTLINAIHSKDPRKDGEQGQSSADQIPQSNPSSIRNARTSAQNALLLAQNTLKMLTQAYIQDSQAEKLPEIEAIKRDIEALEQLVEESSPGNVSVPLNGNILDTRA